MRAGAHAALAAHVGLPVGPALVQEGSVGASSRLLRAAPALALAGCFAHAELPASPRGGLGGALHGYAPAAFDARIACGAWEEAAGTADPAASTHASFPERSPSSCFVRVHHEGARPVADPVPEGCGYPEDAAAAVAALGASAALYERIAEGAATERALGAPLPMPVACALPDEARRRAAAVNARTMRSVARKIGRGKRWAYAAAATFGFGHGVSGASALVPWRPGDACPALGKREMDLFGINIVRAGRAAAVHLAGIAPVVSLSGGAVHSPLYEAFMMDYLVTCRFGVRPDAVLLDPCADHTHTNARNTGALVIEMGARTAYVATDDGLQADYLQEWTLFDVIGGSIDQRALRDWGYLVGSWRQAGTGIAGGYWFTPYRFWAEPRRGLGSFACVR